MRPAGRAVIAVVLLDENCEGVGRSGSPLLGRKGGRKEEENQTERQSVMHPAPGISSDYLLTHLIEPPAGRGRGGRRLVVDEQLESAATLRAHFSLNVEGLGVAAYLGPAVDAPLIQADKIA